MFYVLGMIKKSNTYLQKKTFMEIFISYQRKLEKQKLFKSNSKYIYTIFTSYTRV